MYYCSNCGASLSAGVETCPHCGAAFRGTGTGTEAERRKKEQDYKDFAAADKLRAKRSEAADKKRARERKAGLRADPGWEKAAKANAEALTVLETYCATLQQNANNPDWVWPRAKSVSGWAYAVVWMRTRPSERDASRLVRPYVTRFYDSQFYNPPAVWALLGRLVGYVILPRNLDRPTKKAMRYVADGLGLLHRRGLGLSVDAAYTASKLKTELDRLLK